MDAGIVGQVLPIETAIERISLFTMTPETRPERGADVPPRAPKPVPECGADENTGWSTKRYASDLGAAR